MSQKDKTELKDSNTEDTVGNDDEEMDCSSKATDEESEAEILTEKITKRDKPPGIIYLSRIPEMMNVKKVRQIFSEFGEVDRIFLQPDEHRSSHTKNRFFTEGWVEFVDKRVAKTVAASLNNQRIGGKRRSRWYDELWNMKYLPKFQWTHLNERLAYERAVHKQRLRTEVSQVKREMTHFVNGVEKKRIQERIKQRKSKQQQQGSSSISGEGGIEGGNVRGFTFRQKQTNDEVVTSKKKSQSGRTVDKASAALDKEFLRGLFSGGGSSK